MGEQQMVQLKLVEAGGSGGGGGGGFRPTSGSGGTGNTPPVSPAQGNNGGGGNHPQEISWKQVVEVELGPLEVKWSRWSI